MTETRAPGIDLEIVGMTKRFGALTALDNVSLKVAAGSLHALLGENGAGKSTLVKCVMGFYRADDGSVVVNRREREINGTRDAHALGLGMVYQHFTLVPNMTVAENLVLARAHLPAVIRWREERRRLAAFLERMPFKVPLDARVASISAGEKQKAEILKQMYLERRLLILDEPTSVLTPSEADEMLGLLREMAHRGALTVLMITHKFREVLAFADRVSVLRRGRLAGEGDPKALGADEMARMMVGSQAHAEPARRTGRAGAPRLELDSLAVENDAGEPAVRGVTLAVRSGEIVGIAGVSGNGQRELVEAVCGQREAAGGAIRLNGAPYRGKRAEMRAHGFASLPEEPLRSACVPTMSVAENLSLRVFDEPRFAWGGWWLRLRPLRQAAAALIARYRVKTASSAMPIGTLSGGNVQRAVLARELGGPVNVLVAANPCFGLDFAAVADIHGQIMATRNRGAAVLLVSEDLDEILELADRVVVMSGGRLVHETPAAGADLTAIGRHMAGH